MIKITSLEKYFNKGKSSEIHVINNTSIELPEKGLVTFLGPSGCGKTTLLNTLGGLDSFNSGTIQYDDLAVDKYKAKLVDAFRCNNVGYIFQNYLLFPDKTVLENLEIALEIMGITDEEEIKKRIEYTLKAVGLFKYRKKLSTQLSGGQQQRVSIARALLNNAKVIIADEPTGNLDKDNSIEIMNILKRISEKSLVLLVTHNQELAGFYADRIIKLKDGVVVSDEENKVNHRLSTKTDKKIYLKDLVSSSAGTDNLNVKLYTDESIGNSNIDITIVYKNGTIYLKADEKVKLVDNDSVVLLDEHYEELSQEELQSSFTYDTTWFSETQEQNFSFAKMGKRLKHSWLSFIHVRKRTAFLFFTFFCLGAVMGIMNITFSNYNNYSTNNLIKEPDVYCVDNDKYYFDSKESNVIINAYEQGSILFDDISYTYFEVSKSINSYRGESASFYTHVFRDDFLEDNEIIAGRKAISFREVVIGKSLYNKIAAFYGYDKYEDILNTKIDNYIVCGVSSKDSDAMYNSATIDDFIANSKLYNDINATQFLYKDYEKYEITKGRDIQNNKEILYVGTSYDNKDIIGKTIPVSGQQYTIVGTAKLANVVYKEKEFITKELSLTLNNNNLVSEAKIRQMVDMSKLDYKVVEGRIPANDKEIMVYAYTKISLGTDAEGYKVVGKYVMNSLDDGFDSVNSYFNINYGSYTLATREAYKAYKINALKNQGTLDRVGIKLLDEKAALAYFEQNGMKLVNSYEFALEQEKAFHHISQIIYAVITIVLLLIYIVFIYFTMRSRMIGDIYNIGVYRCLGEKKHNIIGRNLSDVFVITTFTGILGYLFVTIIGNYILSFISSLGASTPKLFTLWHTYGFMLLIYGLNILFGLLPIGKLLRLTPSEIISKYDI